jgi:hypothetical protein
VSRFDSESRKSTRSEVQGLLDGTWHDDDGALCQRVESFRGDGNKRRTEVYTSAFDLTATKGSLTKCHAVVVVPGTYCHVILMLCDCSTDEMMHR